MPAVMIASGLCKTIAGIGAHDEVGKRNAAPGEAEDIKSGEFGLIRGTLCYDQLRKVVVSGPDGILLASDTRGIRVMPPPKR